MNTKVIITAEDQTSAGINSVKSSLAGLGSAVGLLMPLLSGFASAFSAGAFISIIKGSIDAADAMKDLSERTGLSIKELATWELAAKQSGTGLESVAQGIKGLSKYMVGHSRELQAAGITATTTNGAMLQLADLFEKLPDGALKSALAVKVFGRAGDSLIPMLNQGSKGLTEATEKSADYAKRLEELAPKADQFNDQMTELGLQSKAAGMNIADYFLPGLIGMSKWLNDIASGGEKAQTAVEWLWGERIMKAMALAGHLNGPDKRSSSGKISGGPADLAAFDDATERFLAEREAEKTACKAVGGRWDAKTNSCVLGEEGKAKAAKTKEPIDVFGSGSFITSDKDTARRIKESYEFEHWAQTELIKDRDRAAAAAEKEAAAQKKRAEAIKDEIEPLRVLAREIEDVNRLRDAGLLTADQASAAEVDLAKKFAKQRESMLDLKNTGKDAFSGITDAIENFGNKAADTFADFATGGKASFSDLINSMLKDILRLQAKQMFDPITKGAGDWLTGLLKGAFGGGGQGSVQGNANYIWDLHSGGIAGAGEGSGQHMRSLAMFAGAPKYHGGGLAGDEVPAVLKRGEGVFTPGQMAALGGGAGTRITVNLIENGSKAGQVQQRNEGGVNMLDIFVDRIKSSVASDIADGRGAVPAALQTSYGLNRAAGAY